MNRPFLVSSKELLYEKNILSIFYEDIKKVTVSGIAEESYKHYKDKFLTLKTKRNEVTLRLREYVNTEETSLFAEKETRFLASKYYGQLDSYFKNDCLIVSNDIINYTSLYEHSEYRNLNKKDINRFLKTLACFHSNFFQNTHLSNVPYIFKNIDYLNLFSSGFSERTLDSVIASEKNDNMQLLPNYVLESIILSRTEILNYLDKSSHTLSNGLLLFNNIKVKNSSFKLEDWFLCSYSPMLLDLILLISLNIEKTKDIKDQIIRTYKRHLESNLNIEFSKKSWEESLNAAIYLSTFLCTYFLSKENFELLIKWDFWNKHLENFISNISNKSYVILN